MCRLLRSSVLWRAPSTFNGCQPHATYVGEGKSDLNVCFVAERYMAGGLNKGFPEFLETVLRLRKAGVSATGHVVGGCTPDDSPSAELLDGITFYGRLTTEALMDFFSSMDVIVSANRPGVLIEGNFDGFPTGAASRRRSVGSLSWQRTSSGRTGSSGAVTTS